MTPWGPILLVAMLAVAGALLVWRATGNSRYGASAGAFVFALAAGAFGAIATVGFIAVLTLVLVGAALFMSGRSG